MVKLERRSQSEGNGTGLIRPLILSSGGWVREEIDGGVRSPEGEQLRQSHLWR